MKYRHNKSNTWRGEVHHFTVKTRLHSRSQCDLCDKSKRFSGDCCAVALVPIRLDVLESTALGRLGMLPSTL